MKDKNQLLRQMKELDLEINQLEQIMALLEWDHETGLPPKAVNDRAGQLALVGGMHHEKVIAREWETLFDELECTEDGESSKVETIDEKAYVRECYKRWAKVMRVPQKLVEELSRQTSLSQAAWVQARKENDFSAFQPHLETLINLNIEAAQAIAPGKDVYDTLMDEYEPGTCSKEVNQVFNNLSSGLEKILDAIQSFTAPNTEFLDRKYPVDKQNEFGQMIQKAIGYDYDRGRLDISAHPFSTTLGPHDVRITTRYREEDFLSGLYSNIHEAGHGLYEQGIDEQYHNTVLSDGTSLGIHESQSRFWENTIGRSRAFWKRWLDPLRGLFPENLKNISDENFYRGVNRIKPSLIRIEADEVTYSFHIIIRFQLEQALVRREMRVSDLPEAWRSAYESTLKISPETDADGCMQDIHWSAGLIGYFPTYVLGNLYAAQFTRVMEKDLGSIDHLIQNDRVGDILSWLQNNIHRHGRVFSPKDLCQRVSGEPLNANYFLEYIGKKYSDIYGFQYS